MSWVERLGDDRTCSALTAPSHHLEETDLRSQLNGGSAGPARHLVALAKAIHLFVISNSCLACAATKPSKPPERCAISR